jgi:PadR family transcriptional regulator
MEQKPLRVTRAVVLVAQALLEKHDEQQWGYDVAQRAGVSSNALYQVLNRFHERGWLADGWEEVDRAKKRPARRYYTITPNGMARLGALLAHAAQDRRFAGLNLNPGIAQ